MRLNLEMKRNSEFLSGWRHRYSTNWKNIEKDKSQVTG